MVESVINTSRAEILLYFDTDDPTAPRPGTWNGPRIHVTSGPRIGRGKAINLLCQTHDYDAYLLLSDDARLTRSGWDREVEAALNSFPNRIGLVHLSSGIPEGWVNWPCISKEWLSAVGWFHYPGLEKYCQDTVLQTLGEALDRIAYIDPPCIHHDCLSEDENAAVYQRDREALLWFFARGGFRTALKALRGV